MIEEKKAMNWQRSLLFLLAFVIVGSASAQDTLKANADSVTLKFENDRVRVLESALKPGAKENEHSHPNYVTYVISGGKVRNHSGGTVSLGEFKTGEVLFRDARTHWSENIGKTTTQVVMFELRDVKDAGEPYKISLDMDPVKLSPQFYKVLVDNEYVRVLEYRLKPGQKEPKHSHPCGVVYYLTGTTWRTSSPDGKTTESETTAGTVVWRDPITHAAENVGKTDARAIAIEFKGPCGK